MNMPSTPRKTSITHQRAAEIVHQHRISDSPFAPARAKLCNRVKRNVGGWLSMKLRDVLDHDRLLLVACNDCHGKTPLDPARFALRVGVHTDIADLLHELNCPVCGSADIVISSHSPLETHRPATPPPAADTRR